MSKAQVIQATTVCTKCDGKGNSTFNISIVELMDAVDYGLSTGNKLQAIKDVRTKWSLGLRAAKDLVEAYQTFLAAMPNTKVLWDWERS